MTACESCGQPLADAADLADATKTLLRASNIAEAGYLADRLRDGGFVARVTPAESFDAVTGAWSMGYCVLVEPESAADAAAYLHAAIAESDPPAPLGSAAPPTDAEPRGLNLLSGFGVLVAAVVGGLLLARPVEQGDPRRNAAQRALPLATLSARLDRLAAPLVAVTADGATHRLSVDRPEGLWLLETDTNGDGRFDRREVFADRR